MTNIASIREYRRRRRKSARPACILLDSTPSNNNNLYLSVKAKIAVTEPLNGDTISEIYIYININVNIKVLKKQKTKKKKPILNKLCTLI